MSCLRAKLYLCRERRSYNGIKKQPVLEGLFSSPPLNNLTSACEKLSRLHCVENYGLEKLLLFRRQWIVHERDSIFLTTWQRTDMEQPNSDFWYEKNPFVESVKCCNKVTISLSGIDFESSARSTNSNF